eukprot:CAMPEP_0197486014 /NCGR_PEP_ID=MMETSP1311-20131121/926_1 /TAXON_ID=464262 /ORGANISM="Genus nov. species nov., Strain RCC856" /LENGTH=68 /DNA_ID=CAMNT_0043028867 /DNA_START=166 /DNA_END=368 /DNA_ORIENTATION=+
MAHVMAKLHHDDEQERKEVRAEHAGLGDGSQLVQVLALELAVFETQKPVLLGGNQLAAAVSLRAGLRL